VKKLKTYVEVKLLNKNGRGKNIMKKVLVLAGLALLLAASPAYAEVHTGFSTDTSGCAACHITHAAKAKKLLLSGTTQTEFCMVCHDSLPTKSPFDVLNGVALKATEFSYSTTPNADWGLAGDLKPSFSGGFQNSYNFDALGDGPIAALGDVPSDIAVVSYNIANKFNPSKSAHSVEGYGNWTTGKLPGSANAVTGNLFTCSSCHDPHGFNNTQAGGGGTANNPRLLRHDFNGATNLDVKINFTAAENRTLAYPDTTINTWCAGCHEMLNVGKNAGSNPQVGAGAIDTRYRHAMGIAVDDTVPGFSANLANGIPLSTAGKKILCVSCHRAHGSASPMTTLADGWVGQDYDNADTSVNHTGSGSALLRLKNRDVCYKCHLEASGNTNTTSGAARLAP